MCKYVMREREKEEGREERKGETKVVVSLIHASSHRQKLLVKWLMFFHTR